MEYSYCLCTGLVGGGLWQFVLLYVELRSLMQGGQGISKILEAWH